jgi:MATE family multidrug resistance protein
MLIAALIAVFDGMSVILCGQLRAIGRPLPGSVAMFLGHYVAGIPSGIALGFWFKLGIYGVVLGLASTFF